MSPYLGKRSLLSFRFNCFQGRLEVPPWDQLVLANIKVTVVDLLTLPPEAGHVVSTTEDVLDRNVNAKEKFTNNYPGKIVDYELGSLVKLSFLPLENQNK